MVNRTLTYLVAVIFSCISIASTAQINTDLLKKVISSASEMKSLECDFTQTVVSPLLKDAVISKGHMSYISPNMVRWEYNSPYSFCLQADEDRVIMLKDGIEVDSNSAGVNSRMVQGMVKMLMGSIQGSFLTDTKSFDIEALEQKDNIVVTLIPKRGDVRKMYKKMIMSFDKITHTANSLDLYDNSENLTKIEFYNLHKS